MPFLRDLTWIEAEGVLTQDALVVLPVGAAAKEHGPHLRLDNDERLAEAYARLVEARARVVVAPTLTYSYYPAFVEYPGSTSLRLETARDLVVDVVRSIARHGPRRFYALNTGVSTIRALAPAAEIVAADGVLLRYTDLVATLGPIERGIAEQEGGTHADEVETSIVLHLFPERADMTKAARDYHPNAPGGLTRDPNGPGTYSPTGTWGDPTLATRDKGARVVDAFVAAVIGEIEALRATPVDPGSPPQKIP